MSMLPKIPVPAPIARIPKAPPRLKRWTFAGLLITYWCNAQCAFCYVYSGPNKKGPTLTADQALHFWSGLNQLLRDAHLKEAGQDLPCKVHFAGGEPFFNFPRLLEIAQAAQAANLSLFEKVETNAFWAIDDDTTRQKIQALADAGMTMLHISADVYHQEFVPVERCKRAARIGAEILGKDRVRVRWWDFIDQPIDVQAMAPADRQAAYADALVRHRERILGRAADLLADHYECHPPEYFAAASCSEETLGSKHVHIDAYGNVFPGVCSGIVWGTVALPLQAAPDAGREPDATEWPASFPSIPALWNHAAAAWSSHPIISRVVQGGSYALYELARQHGFSPRRAGYANKCHLCHDVRRHLFSTGLFSTTLGPAEVYFENPPSQDAASKANRALSLPVLNAGG